jgi:hypothetical protein
MMETGTADLACKSGFTKGKLWKFMTGRKPEFEEIRMEFKAMGQQFIEIGLRSDAK